MSGKQKGYQRWLSAKPHPDGSLWPSDAGRAVSPGRRCASKPASKTADPVPRVSYRLGREVAPFTSAEREFLLHKLRAIEKSEEGIKAGIGVKLVAAAVPTRRRQSAAVIVLLIQRGLVRDEPNGAGGTTLHFTEIGTLALQQTFEMGSPDWAKRFPKNHDQLRALVEPKI